jgi:hypothetical protein
MSGHPVYFILIPAVLCICSTYFEIRCTSGLYDMPPHEERKQKYRCQLSFMVRLEELERTDAVFNEVFPPEVAHCVQLRVDHLEQMAPACNRYLGSDRCVVVDNWISRNSRDQTPFFVTVLIRSADDLIKI